MYVLCEFITLNSFVVSLSTYGMYSTARSVLSKSSMLVCFLGGVRLDTNETLLCRLKKTDEKFCRNKYNASGMCSYRACPLANSQYATVLEKDGKSYLNIKTIERAHLPKKLWEAIELSKDTKEALAQVCYLIINYVFCRKIALCLCHKIGSSIASPRSLSWGTQGGRSWRGAAAKLPNIPSLTPNLYATQICMQFSFGWQEKNGPRGLGDGGRVP